MPKLRVLHKPLTMCLCLAVLTFGGGAAATTAVITLDDGTIPAGVMCGDTWTEAGVVLSFVPTTDEDCAEGSCFFGFGGFLADGVDLYPCRLNADLSGLPGTVLSAEVDIIDGCGVGCTRAFLYDGAVTTDSASNISVMSPETFSLASGGGEPDRLAVSSCEGGVGEIRVLYQASPVEPSTWGKIRSLYR